MKKIFVFCTATLGFLFFASSVFAQTNNVSEQSGTSSSRGAKLRAEAGKIRRNHTFSDFGKEYTDFKNTLSEKYGFDYSLDISYMPQRGTPSGKKTSYQTMIYPSFSWTTFNNEYGTGTLNFAYTVVRYGGISANHLANNMGVVTAINDYASKENAFDELYYTYTAGGNFKWLTLAIGQFPLYNFDGTQYDANQQVNFINYALSQNASSTYPTAGVGAYVQADPNPDWSFAVGAQDATNVDAISVRLNHLDDEHYTTFASVSYTPTIKGLGDGQYSILVYNQPSVKEQNGTTNGWSLNLSQNIGEKLNLFARVNGVSGDVATINQSWVIGAAYNNPLDRNPLDQIGLAFAYNKIDEKAVGNSLSSSAEKVVEAYWAWGISKWLTITPDVQFYISPAQNEKSDYGAAFSLRATLFF